MNFDLVYNSFSTSWNEEFSHLTYRLKNVKSIESLNKNVFLSCDCKEYLLLKLNEKTRETYLFKKYYYRWRTFIIKNKDSTNHLDLELNPIQIDSFSNILVFDYLNNRKYVFTQKEIIKLIENSFFHSYPYDPEPDLIPLKNPYTNSTFNKYQLKDIDKQILASNRILIWELYKNNGYNLDKLKKTHYSYLQLKCIPYYVSNLDNDDIKYYLDDILEFIDEPQLSKKKICRKCLEDSRNYKRKAVVQLLIEWIEFLKLKRNAQEIQSTISKFYIIFSDSCKRHKNIKRWKSDLAIVNNSDISNPFTNTNCTTNFTFNQNSINSVNSVNKNEVFIFTTKSSDTNLKEKDI
jgi:hypothetical protein